MTRTDPWYPPRRVAPGAALLVTLAVLAVAVRVAASGDDRMAVYLDPGQADGLVLREVLVRLDGRELPVRLPAADAPEQPIAEAPMGAGPHAVDVEARLDGQNDFFTYVNLYRFTMRGHLELPARSGEVTAVKVGLVRRAGMFLRWEDRYRLAVSATSYRSAREEAIVPPEPAPAPVSDTPPVAACSLQPVTFAFDQAVLRPEARQALERFATCLAPTARALRVEGHCDVRGGADYNRRLGQRRADAVAKYLRERGLTAVRFTSRSWGKSRPLCGEATEACHARNRRVEVALEE